MRKKLFLTFYISIILYFLQVSIIYGEEEKIYTYGESNKVYINGVFIDSYDFYNQHIIAEDLRNYGFNVTWNADNKVLNINRIANSFPSTYTPKVRNSIDDSKSEEYIVYKDIRAADYRILMDGIEIGGSFTKDGTLISIEELEKYGSLKKIEGKTTYYYITLSYNYPTVTAPDGTAIKVTQPVYDYARDVLLKEVNPDTSAMLSTPFYTKEPHLTGIRGIINDLSSNWNYTVLENEAYINASILNELNLDYIVSNNKLTILSMPSKEIKLEYQAYRDFGEPILAGEYRPEWITELSCVDLKLFSNETEIEPANEIPSFLDCNGNLVIKLQDLSEALHMNFKKEVTSNGSELYYKMTPKQ